MNASLQDRRTWLVGGAAAAAVVSAASWFFVISPVLSDTDSVQSQTASVQQQTVVAQQKLRQLADSHSQLPGLKTQLVAALAALPMQNGLPDLTRQLNRQASALGLSLDSLNVGGFSAANVAAAATTTGGATGTGPVPASVANASTTGTAPATTGTAPAATAATPGGTVAISITLTSSGPDRAQLAFLRLIRLAGPRVALVSSVSLSAKETDKGKPSSAMTVTLTVFATPQTADQRAQIAKLLQLK